MAQDVQLLPFQTADAPNTWTIPDALKIIMKAVTAEFDGSAAASAFLPTLEIRSDSGELVARIPTSDSVPAGGFAEVTWAPFLRNAPSTTPAGGAGVSVANMWFNNAAFGDPFVSVPNGAALDVPFANTFIETGAPMSVLSVVNPNDTLSLDSTDHLYVISASSFWQAGGFVQQTLLSTAGATIVGGELLGNISNHGAHPADYFSLVAPLVGVTQGQVDYMIVKPAAAGQTVTLNALHNSGVPKNLSFAYIAAMAFPRA